MKQPGGTHTWAMPCPSARKVPGDEPVGTIVGVADRVADGALEEDGGTGGAVTAPVPGGCTEAISTEGAAVAPDGVPPEVGVTSITAAVTVRCPVWNIRGP